MTRAERAVVIGGSIAGILAARALREHVEQVVILDRDDMPSRPDQRGGVPQGRHAHGLVARGLQLVEEMFPGVTDTLVERGARVADVGHDAVWCFGDRPLASFDTDLRMLMVSRPLLEWTLRQRLLVDPGVELREDASVLDLRFSRDAKRVDGVVVRGRDGGHSVVLDADLVVDATGRASRTPAWLESHGYPVPIEEVRRVDKRYATRRFVSGPDTPTAVAVGAGPGLPRSGIMVQVEGGQHVVSLVGMLGTRPPVAAAGWQRYARTLANPALADALDGMVAIDEAVTYRFPANRRRRYERLDRFPDGLFVTGDALCAFDPVYGHGMSVAALEARELSLVLGAGGADLSRRFHRRAARHVDTPWTIATGHLPDERGRVARRSRLFSAYLRTLLRAGSSDPELAHAFARVSHLVDPPTTLTTPGRLSRVLTGSRLSGRRTDRSRAAVQEVDHVVSAAGSS